MSIEQLGGKEFARRNLWEATLFDENRLPLLWSTGLIRSANIPKLQFTIEDIFAGTSKGYLGWRLPDNIQLGIWETSDHQVEKYLDEWMIGKTGVFNPDSGAFRVHPNEDFIYRGIRIKTFIYEHTESVPYRVRKKEVVSALSLVMREGLEEQDGEVSVEQQEYINSASEAAVDEIERSVAVKETAGPNVVDVLENKQVIPVLNKATAAAGMLVNQMVARVPVSDITRRIMPPVVIPPPLMRVPVATGSPARRAPVVLSNLVKLPNPPAGRQRRSAPVTLLHGVQKKVEEILVDFASGAAANARQWKAIEKTTSLITYDTAIENYDIGLYDYATGEGVSYNVNLAVRDMKIEYPV